MEQDKCFYVPPLSIQEDGTGFVVGSDVLNDYFQFPKEAIQIIGLLKEGNSLDEIKKKILVDGAEQLDVDDFIELLVSIGFLYKKEEEYLDRLRSNNQHVEGLSVSINQNTALKLTSTPFRIGYCLIVFYAMFLMFKDSTYAIDPMALVFDQNLTFSLVLLLFLYLTATMLHEFGHMVAAARIGARSTLHIGNRLWNIVLEADITDIMSQPQIQRYLPILAGIIMDFLTISLVCLAIKYMVENNMDPYYIQIAKALTLQIIITIIWQFNLFLKTDIYYLICTYFNYHNLDAEARKYLYDKIYSVSLGRFGKKNIGNSYSKKKVLLIFSCIWVFGRIVALGFLFIVVIPTLLAYFMNFYRASQAEDIGLMKTLDLAMFFVICVSFFLAGLYKWIKQKRELE